MSFCPPKDFDYCNWCLCTPLVPQRNTCCAFLLKILQLCGYFVLFHLLPKNYFYSLNNLGLSFSDYIPITFCFILVSCHLTYTVYYSVVEKNWAVSVKPLFEFSCEWTVPCFSCSEPPSVLRLCAIRLRLYVK